MLIEAAEEEQQFQQFRERNRIHHVSYVGTVGKLMSHLHYLTVQSEFYFVGMKFCITSSVVSRTVY